MIVRDRGESGLDAWPPAKWAVDGQPRLGSVACRRPHRRALALVNRQPGRRAAVRPPRGTEPAR
eukprot:2013349-Prymnesium_polylepis.2